MLIYANTHKWSTAVFHAGNKTSHMVSNLTSHYRKNFDMQQRVDSSQESMHCPIHWHFASCFIPKAATDTRLTTRVPIFSWISCIIERPLGVHIFTVALSIGKELNILDLTSKTKWHNSFSITHTSRGPRKAMSDGSLFHNFRKCFNAMLYTKPNYNIMLSNPTFLNLE